MSLNPTIVSSLSSGNNRIILLADIGWSSGHVYVHNRVGERRWNGKTWVGVGSLASVGAKEDGEKTGRMALSLQVTNPDLLNEARRDDVIGNPVQLYLGVLNDKSRIADAQRIIYKFISDVAIRHEVISTITLQLGSHRERSAKPQSAARMTAASHRAKYPGDSYLDDVEAIAKGPLSSYGGSQSVGGGSSNYGNSGGGHAR